MQAQDRPQPKPGSSPVVNIKKPQTFVLANGMKVLIVDDEPLARSRLKRLMAQLSRFEVVGEAKRLAHPLVRGITEITKATLENQFKDVEVRTEAPYMVRDQLIYGELFTLIPLESTWCRGYMMLQAEQKTLQALAPDESGDFRNLNNALGELTNLIWGWFKNRFINQSQPIHQLSQVPIIINHQHRYISFGSDDAQLCFKYVLVDPDEKMAPLVLYQRFVFNLSWTPEKFKENEAVADDLFESGELELF